MSKRPIKRKELLEHIRQTMPNDLSEIEKLAFIETEIAKQISFDEQYLWGDRETKEKIYKLAKREAQMQCKDIKKKLICVTMAELFGYVAKEMGFDVLYQKRVPGEVDKTGQKEIFQKISPKKQEHVCPIVKLSNGKYIEIDIQSDLYRLQTRSKPKAFGLNQVVVDGTKTSIIDNNTIEKVFRKVYKLQEKERFTDEYIMVFSAMLRCQRKSPIQMLEFFLRDPKIQEELQNTRCIEANKLYKKILALCYDKSEGNQFFDEQNKAIIEECILSNDKGQKRYSFCIYAENDEEKQFYVYSKKSRTMVSLTQDEIQQLTEQVMNVRFRGRASELKNQMISFVKGEKTNTTSKKQETMRVTLEDIFLEDEEEEL